MSKFSAWDGRICPRDSRLCLPDATATSCRHGSFSTDYCCPGVRQCYRFGRDMAPVMCAADCAGTADDILTCNDQAPVATTISSIEPLWKHQEEALQFAIQQRHVYLALEMGCGKTRVAISYMEHLGAKQVLVLCPKAVVSVWPEQIRRFSSFECCALRGSVADKNRQAIYHTSGNARVVVVVNYDSAWREPLAEKLIRTKWDLVVLDEAHRIKSPKAKISKFSWALSDKCISTPRMCLSGTPMPHSPGDIWSQYRFLDSSILGRNYISFKRTYAVLVGPQQQIVVGWRRQDELAKHISKRMMQVRKRDVLTLPPVVDETAAFELSTDEARQYTAVAENIHHEIKQGTVTTANILVKLLRLQMITSGCVMTDEEELVTLGTSRADAFEELLESIPADEPVVVFCRFRHDIAEIRRVCDAASVACAELSGDVNQLAGWKAGGYRVLAAQIQCGKEGVDLTRACYAVFYSMTHSLGDYLQARARVDRPGQTAPVTIIHLLATGTMEEKIYKNLQNKSLTVEELYSMAAHYSAERKAS